MNDVTTRVLEILTDVLETGEQLPQHPFMREHLAAWDSLKHLEIVFALEEEFGIRFTAEQVAQMTGTLQIVEMIEAVHES